MSSPLGRHTLSVSQALARSGIKGGTIPAIGPEITPVMVVADLADSYSGEPAQLRGFAAFARHTIPVNERGWGRLECLSAGGLVVENLTVVVSAATSFAWIDRVPAEAVPAPSVENPLQVVDTGGEPQRSRVFIGSTLALPSGAGPFDFSGVFPIAFPLRGAYVPPGASLIMFSDELSTGLSEIGFAVGWREIPAPIGLP